VSSDASLVAALSDLHRRGPVNGACLLCGDFIVANHLPISDKKVHLLCSTVTEMCDGYQSVGRNITEFYFGYDQCQLFVFCDEPVRLFILADQEADPDRLGGDARKFMLDNSSVLEQLPASALTQRIKVTAAQAPTKPPSDEKEPSEDEASNELPASLVVEPVPMAPDEWLPFRESLHQLLSRVLGSGQSSRAIDRVAKEHGCGKQSPLRDDFESIAQSVVEKVPNRSKRRSL
jgi:hypothetical protein